MTEMVLSVAAQSDMISRDDVSEVSIGPLCQEVTHALGIRIPALTHRP